MFMQKNATLKCEKTKISHNLELYGYFTSKDFRQRLKLYEFEKSLILNQKT